MSNASNPNLLLSLYKLSESIIYSHSCCCLNSDGGIALDTCSLQSTAVRTLTSTLWLLMSLSAFVYNNKNYFFVLLILSLLLDNNIERLKTSIIISFISSSEKLSGR